MKHVMVLDYGVGNLHSVVKALRHEGANVEVTSDYSRVDAAGHLVIPGVGAFADGMKGLMLRSLVEPVRTHFERGRPLLGICLGMQLLFSESEEFGLHTGLGLIPGRVERIDKGLERQLKVPHVGWNRVVAPENKTLTQSCFEKVPFGSSFYFVHSFAGVPTESAHRIGDAIYGPARLCVAVQRGAAVGFQFHPEKSGPIGLTLVKWFLTI